MPCWNLLGVEICLPSLGDITAAILTPMNTIIADMQNAIINTLTPMFNTVVSTLTPFFQNVIDAITGFVADPLASLSTVLSNVWGQVSGLWAQISSGLNSIGASISSGFTTLLSNIATGLSGLEISVTAGLTSLGSSFSGLISSLAVSLNSSIHTAGALMTGALETAEGVILTAFDGMGNAIGGVMGGLFTGFGTVDTDALVGSHISISGIAGSALRTLGLRFSPVTPQEARDHISPFIDQVTAACSSLHVSNSIAEGVSLGQFDICLQEAWRYPHTAAALALATEMSAMPLKEGLLPAYKRYILSTYQPHIPPYMDLISIYVKEGYLPDHWVELPDEMISNFKELGYSEYWTKRLWGKHWRYPSPTQLYDMLHRTAGTKPEIAVTPKALRTMLKLHDFEPKWRFPLEAISWRTWRIYDTRTAWEMGIDDDETLFKRLVDQGYEPKDARLLAEVQKMFVLRSEIDGLTREADQDFIEGWISEAQLKADYDATPYNSYVVELRIAKAKLRRERTMKRDIKAALIDRFKKDDLTEAELKKALSRLGVVEAWIGPEVERAKAYKLRRPKAAG